MGQSRESYVILGGAVPRRSRNEEQAAAVFRATPDAFVIEIQEAPVDPISTHFQESLSLEQAFRRYADRFNGTTEELVQEYLPIPGLLSEGSDPTVGMIWFASAGRVATVRLLTGAWRINTIWPTDLVPVSHSSILSLILRLGAHYSSPQEFREAVVTEFRHLVAIQAGLEQRNLFENVAERFMFDRMVSPELLNRQNDTFGRVLETRGRYSQLLSLLRTYRYFPPSVEELIRQTISDLDALIGSQSTLLLAELQKVGATAASREAAQATAARAAENRLAKVVAALVMPSLWLSLLGTNVLPDRLLGITIPSEASATAAIVGAAVSSVIGWFIFGAIVTSNSKGDTNV